MRFTIPNEKISRHNESKAPEFPKYTSQLINWANQNAQGTRPRVVGQLTELFPCYLKQTDQASIADWENWYTQQFPDALKAATDRICAQIEHLKKAIQLIDRPMIEAWVRDLVISKTFDGMYVQKAILAELSIREGQPYRLATAQEEAKGIDGFVGDTAYSIKPSTYKTMDRLPEQIQAKMVFYQKVKAGLDIEVID